MSMIEEDQEDPGWKKIKEGGVNAVLHAASHLGSSSDGPCRAQSSNSSRRRSGNSEIRGIQPRDEVARLRRIGSEHGHGTPVAVADSELQPARAKEKATALHIGNTCRPSGTLAELGLPPCRPPAIRRSCPLRNTRR